MIRACSSRDEVELLFSRHKITAKIEDGRSAGKLITAAFTGTLRDKQPDAVTNLLKHDEGVL
jgi:hypothetical protein